MTFNGLFLLYTDCKAHKSVFTISRAGSAIPLDALTPGPGELSQPAGCLWLCHLRRASGFSSVFSARWSGAVGRSLMLFKIKVIVALPGEQRGEWQRSWQPSSQDQSSLRMFYLHPPEAPGTVEVSIAASTAQDSILIADTAPGELFFRSLGPRKQRLGLQEDRNREGKYRWCREPEQGCGKCGDTCAGLFSP